MVDFDVHFCELLGPMGYKKVRKLDACNIVLKLKIKNRVANAPFSALMSHILLN